MTIVQRDDGSFYDLDQLPIEILPFNSPSWMGMEIHIRRGRKFVTALEWTDTDPGSMGPPPVIRLNYDNAQALMNNLWIQGYRPNKSLSGAQSRGSFAGTLRGYAANSV